MKTKLSLIFLIVALVLSGCRAGGQAAAAQTGVSPAAALSAIQLGIGTLQLEGTADAVTAAQAKELLTLWKAVRSLSGSRTAAAQEVQALFSQIESTLTAEQITAIAAMQIGQDDETALGLEQGSAPAVQASSSASGAPAGQTAQSGAGGPPAGGDMGAMGGGMELGGMEMGALAAPAETSSAAGATTAARSATSGAQVGVSSAVVSAVITLLEAKEAL